MRNTIIGIIIGMIFGVMAGSTVISDGLGQAQRAPSPRPIFGTESLKIDSEGRLKSSDQPPSKQKASRQLKPLRIVSLFAPNSTLMKDITEHLQASLYAKFYAPNTLIPKIDTINAVKSGTIDAVFAAPGQWDTSSPTLQLFTAIPFGPDSDEFLAWFYHGGGRALFESPFNRQGVHAILCAALPPAGSGWYRSPVRTVEDIQGLKVNSQGLSARVWEGMGAQVKHFDVDQTLQGLKQGELDGAEYSVPSIDGETGFSRFAQNYYFPAWQQPMSLLALIINAKTWKKFPLRTQSSIYQACGDNVRFSLTRANSVQFEALKKLGLAGVQIRRWPDAILVTLKAQWKLKARELVQRDSEFKTAWSSLHLFRRDYAIWRELSRP